MNQTEQTYRAEAGGTTQEEKLVTWFLAHPGDWYDMTELGAMIGAWAVHSRIAGCRRKLEHAGTIENRQTGRDGKRLSYYRFVPTPSAPGGTT